MEKEGFAVKLYNSLMLGFENTFVMLKPEVLRRDLVGRVMQKFEDVGLDITQIKVAKATKRDLERQYVKDPKWMKRVGERTVSEFAKRKINIADYLGTTSPVEIGEMVYHWNIEAIKDSTVIVMVLSGPHAITRVKQIVGVTEPLEALRGTIRGDWCTDSVIYSTSNKRGINNLVHRSSNAQEVAREIGVWFS